MHEADEAWDPTPPRWEDLPKHLRDLVDSRISQFGRMFHARAAVNGEAFNPDSRPDPREILRVVGSMGMVQGVGVHPAVVEFKNRRRKLYLRPVPAAVLFSANELQPGYEYESGARSPLFGDQECYAIWAPSRMASPPPQEPPQSTTTTAAAAAAATTTTTLTTTSAAAADAPSAGQPPQRMPLMLRHRSMLSNDYDSLQGTGEEIEGTVWAKRFELRP